MAENPVETTIHEIAHCLLHNELEIMHESYSKDIKELEAESTAYFVMRALGLTTGLDKSRGYIQHWFNNFEAIEEKTARRIFGAVDKILKAGRV